MTSFRGRLLVEVAQGWIEGRGKADVVKADGPAELARGAACILRSIAGMAAFPPDLRAKADELARLLMKGDPPPVELYGAAAAGKEPPQ